MRLPHTSCYRGKKVKVVLKNGQEIIDHFRERTDRWIVLRRSGRVMKSDVKAFFIIKK